MSRVDESKVKKNCDSEGRMHRLLELKGSLQISFWIADLLENLKPWVFFPEKCNVPWNVHTCTTVTEFQYSLILSSPLIYSNLRGEPGFSAHFLSF